MTPSIEVYGANNLSNKKETNCKTAVPPTVSENNKKLIGEAWASCNLAPNQYCTMYFPSENSYWNPDKDYSQLWIAASQTIQDSTSFMIGKVIVHDYGKVHTDPPSVPENLRAYAATGSTISVTWDPSIGENGLKVAKYRVSQGNKSYDTQHTYHIVSNLEACRGYWIGVQAIDECDNVSAREFIYANTMPSEDIVIRNEPVGDLSIYPNKKLIVEAEKTIILKPGFRVKANNAQELFKARIGCENPSSKDFQQEEEEYYLIQQEDIHVSSMSIPHSNIDTHVLIYPIEDSGISETSLSTLFSSDDNDIFIYPNPTSNILTIEYHQFTGSEKIFLFDINGKLLFDYTLEGIISNIDISSFSQGIYFVKVISHDIVSVKKIIKM
jgi:hypothetical protein